MSPTHQEAITIVVPVLAGAEDRLSAVLADLGADAAGGPVPFAKVPGLHFARMVVIPPTPGLDSPSQLVFLLDCDAPARSRLRRVIAVGGEALDPVLECCEGFAGRERSQAARYRYLRDHTRPTAAVYVNTVGRTVDQIHREAGLREAFQCFLDSRDWSAHSPSAVRDSLREFAASRTDLHWALSPAPGPSFAWRARNKLNLAAGLGLGVVALPMVVLGAVPFAIKLRRLEKSDPAPRVIPDDEHVQSLSSIEDLFLQNQFTAYGELKPGRFRRYLAVGLLWAVNFGARHRFNRADLAGVKTIHAARWVVLDDRRRMVFCSNYDGSLENYMDDFIDKVSWGLNAVFSNGREYPRTNWLVKDGARDELSFKSYIRAHQVPSNVWYSAYPNLTALNIENNAQIRAGLSAEMDSAAAAAWLRRF